MVTVCEVRASTIEKHTNMGEGTKVSRLATRLQLGSVLFALHMTTIVCPGCNTPKPPTVEPSPQVLPTEPTVKQRFSQLTLLSAVDVPTGSVARGFAISPTNGLIAVGGGDGSIAIVSSDGSLRRTLNGHREAVLELAFSPDGTRLLSGGAITNSSYGTPKRAMRS